MASYIMYDILKLFVLGNLAPRPALGGAPYFISGWGGLGWPNPALYLG